MQRVFLLSPANVAGARAAMLLNPQASFGLARQFRREGLPLGSVFTFCSSLYFRGKLAYALRFAEVARGDLVRIITTNVGLADPAVTITPAELRAFGAVDIAADNPAYHRPLRRDARTIAKTLAPDGAAVLLGSIATAKYRDVLLACFGDRLVFPAEFVGRGDMSRGGLLLRAARSGAELVYTRVSGAIFTGKRAARIGPKPR